MKTKMLKKLKVNSRKSVLWSLVSGTHCPESLIGRICSYQDWAPGGLDWTLGGLD